MPFSSSLDRRAIAIASKAFEEEEQIWHEAVRNSGHSEIDAMSSSQAGGSPKKRPGEWPVASELGRETHGLWSKSHLSV